MHWWGGWTSPTSCGCEGPVCTHPALLPSAEALPIRSAVLGAGRAVLEAAARDQSHGTTAQSCQASWLAGQVTCFCTWLHIFLPTGPQASPLLFPWARLFLICSLGVCPSPSSIICSPFSPVSLKNKLLHCSIRLKLLSLPFKLLPNFSRTHLYSCCLLLLLSQQKYLLNCSSNLPAASLLPSVFPTLLFGYFKSSLPPCAEWPWTFKLKPRMFWKSFMSACPEIRDSTSCCFSKVFANPVFSPVANIPDSDTVAKWGRDR